MQAVIQPHIWRMPGSGSKVSTSVTGEASWRHDERRTTVSPDENTYVRDQNARVDPIFTLGTITVAGLRDILADLPDDAVVVVAKDGAGGDDCSPLADVEESWYFPAAGESAPLGRDANGNVHEPGPRDLYAVLLRPTR
jgi:hypothetical protein